MTNPEKIKQILLSEIEKMNQHREDFCKRPGIDFTRDRKISFDTLLHFQISMESGSVSHELLNKVYTDAVIQPMRKRNTCIPNPQTSIGTSAGKSHLTIFRLKGMVNTKYPCVSCVSPLGTAHMRTS